MADVFEGESVVCHAVLPIQSVDGSCLRLVKRNSLIRCVKAGGYYSAGMVRYWGFVQPMDAR